LGSVIRGGRALRLPPPSAILYCARRRHFHPQLLHKSVAVSGVPGFKTRFWKHVLTNDTTSRYSHVWLFDSDLSIERLDLPVLLRVAAATGAEIIQPTIAGGNPGMWSYDERPTMNIYEDGALRCARNPDEDCAACRVATVEVKTPLFQPAAWQLVWGLLQLLPDEVLRGDYGLDLTWCKYVEAKLHGCWGGKKADSERCGAACVVSFTTPAQHLNSLSICRSWECRGKNNAFFQQQLKFRNALYRLNGGIGRYGVSPHDRFKQMKTKSCWSRTELLAARALRPEAAE